MSESGVAEFLGTVALLRGMPADELAELAPALVRLELSAGEVLWRENDEARALMLIERGSVSASLTLPGGAEVELARMGPGEVLGEIPLLDGGRHTATARVLEPATLLALSRADFVALVARRHPTSFAVRRRLCAVVCLRLRRQLAALAATLHGEPPVETASAELAPAEVPARAYLRRLAFFHQLSETDLEEVLAAGTVALCPPGRVLVAEGTPSAACRVTLNGAVEEVMIRGGRRIRVGLAGPGRAFARLFEGSSEGSHAFLQALQRDLMAALRQAHRPHARLASQR